MNPILTTCSKDYLTVLYEFKEASNLKENNNNFSSFLQNRSRSKLLIEITLKNRSINQLSITQISRGCLHN